MADAHKSNIRSYNMSRIRSKDSKPEIIVRKFLHAQGFRFRLHDKKLPGKPDIVLKKYKTAVLVHGCFWHAHPECKESHIPATSQEYWKPKIQRTIERDATNETALKALGWHVIKIWECEIEKLEKREMKLSWLLTELATR